MDIKRVEEIYKEMEALTITLDRDPAARGPKYLQDLISKTRGFLNMTSHFLQETIRERHASEMDLASLEADFEVQSDELLANDRRVSGLPNIDDRKAMINVLLSSDRRAIQALKREIKNLGHVEKAIRLRHKELEGTMSAIRLQRSLVETELHTGSFYGDEGEAIRGWGRKGAQPRPDELDDIEDLNQLWEDQLEMGPSPKPAAQQSVAEPASYDPIPNDPPRYCAECGEPQALTPSGPVCQNGHGGAESLAEPPVKPTPEPTAPLPKADLKEFLEPKAEDPAVERFLTGDQDFDDILASL